MLFNADVVMAILVVLLVARGLWDLFREWRVVSCP
jgi:hypothetical protein